MTADAQRRVQRLRAWAGVVAAVAGLSIAVTSIQADMPASRARTCTDGGLVQGQLLCGWQRVVAIAGRCPGLVAHAGSVVDRECRAPFDGDLMARLGVPVDINTADPVALQSLHGIGPALSKRIVEGRPFVDEQSLLAVRGIGPKTVAKIRDRLRFGASVAPSIGPH